MVCFIRQPFSHSYFSSYYIPTSLPQLFFGRVPAHKSSRNETSVADGSAVTLSRISGGLQVLERYDVGVGVQTTYATLVAVRETMKFS